jgi:hypothetical protein
MTSLFEYDPDIGYRFVPHLKTRVMSGAGGYLVRTNALGFRSEREFERDDRAHRILVFGDSFTAGDGVSNANRYSDVLETLLPPLEVHNFGLPGSGTDQQFIAYGKLTQGAPCDAVVIAVLVENIRRIVSAWRPSQDDGGSVEFVAKPYFELDAERLVRRNDPVPRERVSGSDHLLAHDAETRRSFRFKSVVHLTPAGHRAIAQSLANTLRPLVAGMAPAAGRGS